jgi:hypothetical protein
MHSPISAGDVEELGREIACSSATTVYLSGAPSLGEVGPKANDARWSRLGPGLSEAVARSGRIIILSRPAAKSTTRRD